MITRFVLFVALLGALAIGLYDMFRDPTPETAAAVLQPTPEKVERARRVVQPMVEYMAAQDAASIKQLAIDADADVRARLEDFPVDAITPDMSAISPPPSNETNVTQSVPEGPAGVDWYRDGKP